MNGSQAIVFDNVFDDDVRERIAGVDLSDDTGESETRRREVGRATRSGRVYNNEPDRVVNNQHPRLQSEMRRLRSVWFNPMPDTILNEEPPNDPLGRERDDDNSIDEIQNVSLEAMNHLFGDFAFFMRDKHMGDVNLHRSSPSSVLHNKLEKMHILDALDYLEGDNGTSIPLQQRDEVLRKIVLTLKSGIPKSYKDAWDHPDPKMKTRWRKAFDRELDSMEKRKVWKVIKKKDMPKGRRCVKSKWVFDIKRN